MIEHIHPVDLALVVLPNDLATRGDGGLALDVVQGLSQSVFDVGNARALGIDLVTRFGRKLTGVLLRFGGDLLG